MSKVIDLSTFANGAVAERFDLELKKVLENISDPNTDAKKARKLTLTVTLKADDERDIAFVDVVAKSALAPAKGIETKIILDTDSNGKITGAELKSGIKDQAFIDDDGDISDDKGNKIVEYQKRRDAK